MPRRGKELLQIVKNKKKIVLRQQSPADSQGTQMKYIIKLHSKAQKVRQNYTGQKS